MDNQNVEGFRFHLDVALPPVVDLDRAVQLSTKIAELIRGVLSENKDNLDGATDVHYRLGRDSDRSRSNYMVLTEAGHCTKAKCKMDI
jgi:hypothetical protein